MFLELYLEDKIQLRDGKKARKQKDICDDFDKNGIPDEGEFIQNIHERLLDMRVQDFS